MDSLDLPQDMLWTGKAEPRSPPRCSTNPFLSTAAQQLWPIEDEIFLSCFDLDDDSNTTTTTFGQQYHDIKKQKKQQEEEKEEDAEKSRAEELLLELIELKEEGQWMNQENVDLSLLTASALDQGTFPTTGSIYAQPQPPMSHGVEKAIEDSNTSNYVASTTELLFNEIKNFCTDFEAAGYQHLTPPQSPPTSPMFTSSQYNGINNNTSIPQQHPQPNIYGANALAMTSSSAAGVALNHLQYSEERSFVDLQLQSNDCLDQTFVFDNDDSSSSSPAKTPAPIASPIVAAATAPIDTDALALELIDELLRNKTKDVHENYVLVNTQLDALSQLQHQQQQPLISDYKSVAASVASVKDENFDFCDDNVTQFSTPSYGNSLASSPSRSGSPMDTMDDSQDDDEWKPVKKQKRGSSGSSCGDSSPAKRRPYERGGGELEKKSRKKEQNKNAATRYRQKKKQEVETILEEETRLQKTNKKLATQFNEARREMKYLRNLLRDMYAQNNILV